jgi:hypothetical protein
MPIYLPPCSRRHFLASSLAGGAGLLLPRSTWAAEETTDANRWILLADTHAWENRNGELRGTKPAVNLAETVSQILTFDRRPGGVLFAGDTVFLEGHAADYAMFSELFRPLRASGIPLHIALGNHDNRANFWNAFTDLKPQPLPECGRQVSITPAMTCIAVSAVLRSAN